jgi:hypothetical protein
MVKGGTMIVKDGFHLPDFLHTHTHPPTHSPAHDHQVSPSPTAPTLPQEWPVMGFPSSTGLRRFQVPPYLLGGGGVRLHLRPPQDDALRAAAVFLLSAMPRASHGAVVQLSAALPWLLRAAALRPGEMRQALEALLGRDDPALLRCGRGSLGWGVSVCMRELEWGWRGVPCGGVERRVGKVFVLCCAVLCCAVLCYAMLWV